MPTICSQLFYPNPALWIPQTLCVTHLRSFIMCSQMFVFPEFHYHTLGAYLCFLCALLLKGPFRLRLQLWYWVDDLHSSASATPWEFGTYFTHILWNSCPLGVRIHKVQLEFCKMWAAMKISHLVISVVLSLWMGYTFYQGNSIMQQVVSFLC